MRACVRACVSVGACVWVRTCGIVVEKWNEIYIYEDSIYTSGRYLISSSWFSFFFNSSSFIVDLFIDGMGEGQLGKTRREVESA